MCQLISFPSVFSKTTFFVAIVYASAALNVATAEDSIDFNRDSRLILSKNFFYCHGQDGNKRQAGLRIGQREAAIVLEAIVPGDVESSVLVNHIDSDEADIFMPPPDSNRQLTSQLKDLLRRWIAAGAHYQTHWAFVPPRRPKESIMRDNE